MVKTIVVLEDGKVTHSIDENDWDGVEFREGRLVAKTEAASDSTQYRPNPAGYSANTKPEAGENSQTAQAEYSAIAQPGTGINSRTAQAEYSATAQPEAWENSRTTVQAEYNPTAQPGAGKTSRTAQAEYSATAQQEAWENSRTTTQAEYSATAQPEAWENSRTTAQAEYNPNAQPGAGKTSRTAQAEFSANLQSDTGEASRTTQAEYGTDAQSTTLGSARTGLYQTDETNIRERIADGAPSGQGWRSGPAFDVSGSERQWKYSSENESLDVLADARFGVGAQTGNTANPYVSPDYYDQNAAGIHSVVSSKDYNLNNQSYGSDTQRGFNDWISVPENRAYYRDSAYENPNRTDAETPPAFKSIDSNSGRAYIRREASESKLKKTKGLGIQFKKALSILLIVLLSASAGFGGGYLSSKYNNQPVLIGGATQAITISPSEQISTTEVVAAKVIPSVVGITSKAVRQFDMFFFGSTSQEIGGVGTGIVVDEGGYILTNSHVVMDGDVDSIVVLLPDGREIEGSVLWQDISLDLAIVRVEVDNLVAAELGDSDNVRIGSYVAAIGNPLGLDFRSSVSQGVVSGLDRTITASSGSGFGAVIQMEGLLQVDAAINNGNSGGPLVNSKGEVIGINTAKNQEGEGMGFAIPINVAKPIVDSVKNTGEFHRVYIGITPQDVSNRLLNYPYLDLGVDKGAYVVSVTPGSPAEKAGVEENDIITELNGKEVRSSGDLIKQLLGYKSGDKVTLTVVRDKNTMHVDVILTDKLA